MKKRISRLAQVLSVLLMIFSAGILFFTIITVRTVGQDASLFGFRVHAVLSDSMSDTFSSGDLVVSRQVDPSTLEAGDIIAFRSIDPDSAGQRFTHKIRAVTTYENEPAFVTYGTTNDVNDSYPVPFDQVEGKYLFSLPGMGRFFQWFRTPVGYVSVVLIPFLILIGIQGFQFVRLVKLYRQEKDEVQHRQASQMIRQQAENEAMRQELEQLRAQLANGKPASTDASQDT